MDINIYIYIYTPLFCASHHVDRREQCRIKINQFELKFNHVNQMLSLCWALWARGLALANPVYKYLSNTVDLII